MATNKQAAEAVLAKIAAVARMRPMFGGYVIYVEEKVIGQFDENQLFIKTTKFGEQYASELERASPYPGAKPAFVVPVEKLDDADWLREFLMGTRRQVK